MGTAGVPDRVDKGGTGTHVVVPKSKPFLNYASVSAAALIRVIPS